MLERPAIAKRRRRRGLLAVLAVAVVAGAVVATALVYRADLGRWIAGQEHDATGPSDRSVAFYTCAMDPSVESAHPGTCPICGMELTPVTKAERASGIVHITTPTRTMMGLAVAPAAIKPQTKRVIASGQVVAGSAGPDRATISVRVYRGDPGDVQPGQRVHAWVAELPVTRFTGTVAAIIPGDPPGGLSLVVDDPGHVLGPGMRASAELEIELAPRLVVPAEAVLHAGARRIVFVERASGEFEPRAVKIGLVAGGVTEVIEGIAAGEPVVVQGVFLLAAESRLRSDSPLWDDRPPPAPIRPAPAPVLLPKPAPTAPPPRASSTASATPQRSARP